ncbi:MAG TPA: FAD-binding oxidoreductase [Limnochordia bacterium]|nr:FAD-binding oxidoreductase [Limnochordia bacterium]
MSTPSPEAFQSHEPSPSPIPSGPDLEHLDPRGFARLGPVTCAVRPKTPVACARALAAAREAGLRVLVHGGGTQLEAGHPAPIDVVLDTRALDRVIAYEPEDMTVTIGAGLTLRALQERLQAGGQFLPLDPPVDEGATLGGLVAADASGPWRFGYGTLRDMLIGAQLATADGALSRAGGRVVKNVAGYELCKLYTGSWGTLGVLTELTFKVRPLPRSEACLQLAVGSLADAERAAALLLDADLEPVAVEFLPAAVAAQVGLPLNRAYGVFALFAGEAKTTAWQLERAARLVEALGDAQALTDGRRVHQALVAAHRPGSRVALRASVLSSAVARFCGEAEALCAGRRAALRWAAHAGSGVVSLQLQGDDDTVLADLCDQLLALAAQPATAAVTPDQSGRRRRAARFAPTPAERQEAERLGSGNLVVVAAPAELRAKVAPWGRIPPSARLMRALKQTYDPSGVLNPGRFIDGL